MSGVRKTCGHRAPRFLYCPALDGIPCSVRLHPSLQRTQGTGYPLCLKRFLLAGLLCIFGGESLCILGPLLHERSMQFACHTVLHSGIALALIGTLLYLSGKRGTVRR